MQLPHIFNEFTNLLYTDDSLFQNSSVNFHIIINSRKNLINFTYCITNQISDYTENYFPDFATVCCESIAVTKVDVSSGIKMISEHGETSDK